MDITTRKSVSGFVALVLLGACSPARSSVPIPVPLPAPAPVLKAMLPPANPRLPAVPEVRGPLAIKVQYPPAGSTIGARDSNFVFGAVGNGDAALSLNGVLAPVWPNGSFMAWLPVPNPIPATDSTGKPIFLGTYDIVAVVGTDTARLTHTVKLPAPAPALPTALDTVIPVSELTFATLGSPRAPTPLKGTHSARCFGNLSSCELATPVLSDSDRVVIGRPSPTGTYKWFLIPGTTVRILGTLKDFAQVQLDNDQIIWIAKSDMSMGIPATSPVPTKVGRPRIEEKTEWVDVIIPSSAAPAFLVEESDRVVTLTFYGITTPSELSDAVISRDEYVSAVQIDPGVQRTIFKVDLTAAPYGYLTMYQPGQFTLRLRRPPVVDASAPLRGLTIAVDPGHPPVGATGPTGLWEPRPTLAVGFKVRDLLIARGANVVMTRTADEDVDLAVRPAVARKNNAHAFVSIHLNALPDGVNPFKRHGTGTYWFHPQSTRLAQSMDRTLVREMGLPDNGVHLGNFAVIRGTWMPSSLTEGAFIMMPDQEAAMRTPEYQEQYARGIVQGLEDYFRTFTRAR